jgi:hypothetical protein
VYDNDTVKMIAEKNYKENKSGMRNELNKYEYTHDPNIVKILKEGQGKNEDHIRTR